jgi:DNA-binding NarL/FixJ family response regulator
MQSNNMKNNVIRIFIASRTQQDWQRMCNLVGLMSGVEVVRRPENTIETIDVLLETAPDVLILDIDMHKRHSIALLQQVHAQYPTLVIIVVSYYSSPICRRICELSGGAYFLDKPTEFQQIPVIITSFVNKNLSNNQQ